MADDKKRAEMADYLERKLDASLEPVVDEILDAERTETTTYEQECDRVLELQELAWSDFQSKVEHLVDVALERGETCIFIEIRDDHTVSIEE